MFNILYYFYDTKDTNIHTDRERAQTSYKQKAMKTKNDTSVLHKISRFLFQELIDDVVDKPLLSKLQMVGIRSKKMQSTKRIQHLQTKAIISP